nr:guanylate cyclase 32E-like [Onthophagus taurus]
MSTVLNRNIAMCLLLQSINVILTYGNFLQTMTSDNFQCPQHPDNTEKNDYNFLYDYLSGTGYHNFNDSVTIGFLGAYGQAQVALGALPLAIDAVNEDKDLLPGRKLIYIAADIGTNPAGSGLARTDSSLATRAIRIMTEMRDNGTVAFIGPDDTCSSEALVAAAWNLPMISYVSKFQKLAI